MTALWVATTPVGHHVRLSEAAWLRKILVSHSEFGRDAGYTDELRRALEDPDFVVAGWEGELLSVRWCMMAPGDPKHLCVVYRPAAPLGFVITAFFVSRYGKLLRRPLRWQKHH